MLISIWSLRIQSYQFYWKLDGLKDQLPKLKKAKEINLVGDLIEQYIEILIANKKQNAIKGKQVQQGIWLLFISVVLIGSATGITVLYSFTQPAASTFVILDGAYIEGKQSYEPNPVRVRVDKTISVENRDIRIHTVTSGEGKEDPNFGKVFDTGIINPGESMEVMKAKLPPGKYPFFCTVHPHMTGTMILLDRRGIDSQIPN